MLPVDDFCRARANAEGTEILSTVSVSVYNLLYEITAELTFENFYLHAPRQTRSGHPQYHVRLSLRHRSLRQRERKRAREKKRENERERESARSMTHDTVTSY